MDIQLKKKIKSPIIIEGFPGFGLVGTIATEFLIKHLNAKPVGKIWSEELLPIAAIHESRIIEPLGIFYDEKNNIMILHALSGVNTLEWKISESLVQLAKQVNAKEIISLEGVASPDNKANTYYFTNNDIRKKSFEKTGVSQLKEGLVIGVTGALLLKAEKLPCKLSCIFVESQIGLADSKAAARIIEVLDGVLGLKIDFKPLLKAAVAFEQRLKTMLQKSKEAQVAKENGYANKEELNYLG